ncbi:hypothetical protein HDU81_001325 [Chytriomyces hyalinus]|nr:hypothetical protein HDU81_001325 [Chytriomyces hyalinus]
MPQAPQKRRGFFQTEGENHRVVSPVRRGGAYQRRDSRQMRLSSTLQLVNPATSLPTSFHRERSRYADRPDPIDAIPSSSMLRASSVSAFLTTPLAQSIFSSNPQPHGSMNKIHAVELKAVIHSHVPPTRSHNHQRRFFVTDRSVPSHQTPNAVNQFFRPVKHAGRLNLQAEPGQSFSHLSSPLLLCEYWEMDEPLPPLNSIISVQTELFNTYPAEMQGSMPQTTNEIPYRLVGMLKQTDDSIQNVFFDIMNGLRASGGRTDAPNVNGNGSQVPDFDDFFADLYDTATLSSMTDDKKDLFRVAPDGRILEVVEGVVFQCYRVPST